MWQEREVKGTDINRQLIVPSYIYKKFCANLEIQTFLF